MLKMSTVVVVVTVLLLVVCAETAGSKRKQVSTTLKMTAQRNDTGIWTAQFGDYEMVIEHRHFGKSAEGSKHQDGTWTMKLKHTVTVFPDDEDGDNDDDDFFKDDSYSSQRSSWGDEENEVKPSGIKSQRKRLGKQDILSDVLRETNPKKFEAKVHSSAITTPVVASESVGEDETETDSATLLPDNGKPASQRPSYEYEESQDETRFEEQGTPEVSYVPRFEALRSPNPEDTDVVSAQTGRTVGTPLSLQNENDSAADEDQEFNEYEANGTPIVPQRIYQEPEEVIERTVEHPQRHVQDNEANRTPIVPQRIYQEPEEVMERTVGHAQRHVQDNEANRTPIVPQRIYQEPEEVIERTVDHPQRHVLGNPEDHKIKEARKKITVNQERIPTDTQLEVPVNRGNPSTWRNLSPWPALTSTYESQQRPMTSDVAYDDVEAESAAAAQQEADEDDLALAHEKKLVMERFPRSRSLPPYNMGYEHYPGVGWLKLNTSYWQWPEARKACEVEGAHLAVPNSERKIRIFQEIMRRHSYVVERAVLKNQVYVGVYTPDRYRRFTTVLGEPFHPGFPIWFDNEPNNADPGEECVTLHVMGRIRDVPCFYNLPFLCEIREH